MLTPQRPGFRFILRERRLATIQLIAVITCESELLMLQQLRHMGHSLLDPLQKSAKNFPARLGPPLQRQIIQSRAILLELVEIALQEMQPQAVQGLNVTIQKPRGDIVIEWLFPVVTPLEPARGQYRNGSFVRAGLNWRQAPYAPFEQDQVFHRLRRTRQQLLAADCGARIIAIQALEFGSTLRGSCDCPNQSNHHEGGTEWPSTVVQHSLQHAA